MIVVESVLLRELAGGLWHLFAIFLRVSAVVSMMPAFGERMIPARVKFATAVVFTLIVAPATEVEVDHSGLRGLAALVGAEIGIGLALGVALRLFVLALQTAGSIAAQATSLSQILGGAAVEPVPAMGYLLVIAGLALAAIMGLHVRAAQFLIHSYSMFPAGALPVAADLSAWGVRQVSQSFSLAFGLAAPFVIASLVYNLALGVINRAMPQLMVAFVGAPALTFGGILLLFLCAPLILTEWSDALFVFMSNPLGGSP